MNLLNINEVSKLTNLSPDELRDLVSKGIFPEPFGIVDFILRWSTIEVKQWLSSQSNSTRH